MARWMYTDAVELVACPKCGHVAGEVCRTPKGNRTTYPHDERVAALQALPTFNIEDYQVQALTIDDVLARITSDEPHPQ